MHVLNGSITVLRKHHINIRPQNDVKVWTGKPDKWLCRFPLLCTPNPDAKEGMLLPAPNCSTGNQHFHSCQLQLIAVESPAARKWGCIIGYSITATSFHLPYLGISTSAGWHSKIKQIQQKEPALAFWCSSEFQFSIKSFSTSAWKISSPQDFIAKMNCKENVFFIWVVHRISPIISAELEQRDSVILWPKQT